MSQPRYYESEMQEVREELAEALQEQKDLRIDVDRTLEENDRLRAALTQAVEVMQEVCDEVDNSIDDGPYVISVLAPAIEAGKKALE